MLLDLQSHFADDERIDAIFGSRFNLVPIEHPDAGQVEPQFFLVGMDPTLADELEAVRDEDGDLLSISELGPNEIVINERAARELDAEPGDQVRLYVLGAPRQFTVAEIGRDAVLTGNLEAGGAGGLLPMEAYQALLGPRLSAARSMGLDPGQRGRRRRGAAGVLRCPRPRP